MKNILIALSTLFFFINLSPCVSQDKINVLFIGNSLTFYHDMPQTVQSMLNEKELNFKIHQSTFPGLFLGWHLDKTIMENNGESIKVRVKEDGEITETEIKLKERLWDIIVLQEGTLRVLIPEARKFLVSEAIQNFKRKINNPNCRIILFNTWADKTEYPKDFCYPGILMDQSLVADKKYCSEPVENLKEHTDLVNASYNELAEQHKIEVSNNANLFYAVRTNNPEIELFDDNFHPSKYGSFLNACEFYQLFSNKNSSDLKYNGTLEKDTAQILKKIASNNYR